MVGGDETGDDLLRGEFFWVVTWCSSASGHRTSRLFLRREERGRERSGILTASIASMVPGSRTTSDAPHFDSMLRFDGFLKD